MEGTAQEFSIIRQVTPNGEIHIEVSQGIDATASAHKLLDLDPNGLCMRWRAAEVSYPNCSGYPTAEVLVRVALINLACSLAAQLDAEFPAGREVKSEDVVTKPS